VESLVGMKRSCLWPWLLGWLSLGGAVASAQGPLPGLLSATFEATEVTIANMTPGGSVALLSVAKEMVGGQRALVRREALLADRDGDGRVTYTVEAGVPHLSIWALADVTSGAFLLTGPADYEVQQTEFPAAGLHRDTSGAVVLTEASYRLEALLVRPGVGAWLQSPGDGEPNDLDGVADGSLTWAPAAGTPLETTAQPPASFGEADVVIAIDPIQMRGYAAKLDLGSLLNAPGGAR
jgi:hypothetical protein